MLFNEMLRHTDYLTMAGHTMGTSTLDFNRTESKLNALGLVFRMYSNNFAGSIPVGVSGNSPQPEPKYPPGPDQPKTSSGSPTYPLDVFAALTPDRKSLMVAIVNATDSGQKLDLHVDGVKVAGSSTLSQMTGSSLDAATWDMLKRSIPAGLNFTATGMPYWDTDIAGFFSPQIHHGYHAARKLLVDPSDALENVDGYEDYPELFVRWFQWGTFQPVMRAHGERMHNEVWSYGKEAQSILSKYLRLRYQLLPYTYSLAYRSYLTGAPYTRALFMDFPEDPNVADIPDEYMFGPALLVAPVSEQGATSRKVYLPAGCDWYNFWTNERIKGGQTITAAAPIDTIPLFVRAGSILPLGSAVLSADQPQTIISVRVYPGVDADFTLFSDDGTTYGYEKGGGSITKLHWDERSHQLKHEGAAAWSEPDERIVDIVHP